MSINFMGKKYGGLVEGPNELLTMPVFYVFHFDEAESPLDIYARSELPELHSALPTNENMFVKSREVSEPQEGDETKSGKYVVTVTYSNDLRPDDSSWSVTISSNVRPWRLPPYDISVTPIEIQKNFTKAYQTGDKIGFPSQPVLNPAGDPYEAIVLDQNTSIKFSYNLKSFKAGWIDKYMDTVNRSSVVVIDKLLPAHRARLRNLDAIRQETKDEDGNIQNKYWRINVEIEVAREPWVRDIMARGLYFLSGGNKFRIYTDNDGNFGKKADMGTNAIPVDEPQKLNLDGSLYTGSTAVYQTFYDKFYSNWKTLKLPKDTR